MMLKDLHKLVLCMLSLMCKVTLNVHMQIVVTYCCRPPAMRNFTLKPNIKVKLVYHNDPKFSDRYTWANDQTAA